MGQIFTQILCRKILWRQTFRHEAAICTFKRIIYSCLACCVFLSCISSKSITYFQPLSPGMDEAVTQMKDVYTPVIKPGDILSITVNSMDRDDRELFNPLPSSYTVTSQSQVGGFIILQPIKGFMVDTLGNINFPQIGKIHVSGLTSNDIEITLTDLLQEFVKSPTVSVYIANFIISVLGEVARPAQYVIPHNQITIPEALALAGDLTVFGKRKNVLLIRELEGQRRFARIDLTNRNLFESPYYYLHSGDLIYVEPTKGKLTSTDRSYQIAPVIISSLSFLLLILNTLNK